MPNEQENKPCSFQNCKGTMTYSSCAIPPGGRAGFSGEGGLPVGIAEPQPGWICDKAHDHFEPVKS
jgi:hypothetical protein